MLRYLSTKNDEKKREESAFHKERTYKKISGIASPPLSLFLGEENTNLNPK